MGNLLRKRRPSTEVATVGNQTAAVQRMDLPPLDTGYSFWRQAGTPLAWQQEVYRHYDRCGELHFSANSLALMISRCNVAIWTRTPEGEPGKPVTEGKIAKLSAQLGGGDEKPEILRLSALNDFLVGDYYTCVETVEEGEDRGKDRWFVVSVSQMRRTGENTLQFERPIKFGGGLITYQLPDPRRDPRPRNKVMLWRTFTEHAQLTDQPDSSVRAAIVALNLIEQYDKRSSAQNDSRLAGAGVLFLPSSFDFPIPPPGPPGSPPTPKTPVDAFEAKLGEAMGKTLKDPANARSLVPIMATVKGEDIDKVRWLTFETPLDEQTMQRLDQCIRRLALSLEMPPELLLGMGSLNHWGQWATEQSTQKVFVAPRLARWCMAATVAWMNAKLRAMNEDPTKYMVWYDMAALTVRPDRQADALALWDRGLVEDAVVLDAGNWPTSAARSAESYKKWLLTQTLIKNPQSINDPTFIANLASVGIELEAPAPQPALGAAPGNVTAPANGAAIESAPSEPTTTRTPAQEALVTGAEMAAMHSLAVAGKKLLSRSVRDEYMNEFAGRTFDLHTRVPVRDTDHALALLEGTYDLLPALAARTGTDVRILRESLAAYCAGQIVAGRPHDPDALTLFLSEGIQSAGHRFCGPAGCRNRIHPQPCTAAYQVTS